MKRFGLVRLHLTLVLLLGGCVPETVAPGLSGTSREEHPIINGQACSSTEQEAAVALIVEATIDIMGWKLPIRSVMCTGTLIAPDVVLTAAHCAYPSLLTGGLGNVVDPKYHISFTADLTTLVMDSTSIMSGKLPDLPKDAVEVSSWITNPGFSPELLQSFTGGIANLYDVALMFLKTPVSAVQPAVVIAQDEATQLKQESVVTISGWGQQTAAAQNPLIPPPAGTVGKKICAQSYINELGTYEMQIGAGEETSRKCHGDSGGPSFMTVQTSTYRTERVVGITSHAYDKTDCAKGGVDTRVDAWLSWIDQMMQDACSQNKRAWCTVPGLIPPDYYRAPPDLGPPKPEASVPDIRPYPDSTPKSDAIQSADAAPAAPSGSGCAVAPTFASGGAALWLLLGLVVVAIVRRTRARADSR